MFKWMYFGSLFTKALGDTRDTYAIYLPIGLPITSLDWEEVDTYSSFNKTVSRYIEKKVKENV